MADATPVLIGLDWGTTSLRAWLLDGGGTILERTERPAGILQVEDGDFEAVFAEVVGPWRRHGLPALASGMIGARQGWREAPYATCPAGGAELARDLVPVSNGTGVPLSIVPGLVCRTADGAPDVMRGEETQILGVVEGGGGDGLVVLPGTHSKWAEVRDGRVVRFATFMTGELFAVLARHSILGRMMTPEGEEDGAAFARGVGFGAGADGLLGRLFSARTLPLLGELPEAGVRDYLSGLLIGAELREARGLSEATGEVTVVAGGVLAARYARALELRGTPCTTRGEEAAARGLATIARAAGLVA